MPRVASNGAMSDAGYVKELTDAERKARDVLEAARKRKANKMKKARDEAQVEIEAMKKQQEDSLSATLRNHSSDQDKSSVSFEKTMKEKISILSVDYAKNKQKVLEFVIENMINIKPETHQNLPVY